MSNVHQAQTVLCSYGGCWLVDADIVTFAIIDRHKAVVVLAGDCPCRLLDGYALGFVIAGEVLHQEPRLHDSEPGLRAYGRTRLVNARRDIFTSLTHRIVLNEEVAISLHNKLLKTGHNSLESGIAERLASGEDALAFIFEA